MSNDLALRPHHGLCLGFFRGKGYDEAFTRNTAGVLASLTPGAPVRLTMGHDVLCAACPHRGEGCPNAAAYDRRVLALCGLTEGQRLPWERLRQAVEGNILAPGRLGQVCGDCPWAALCGGGGGPSNGGGLLSPLR